MPTADGLFYEVAGEGEPLLLVMGLGTDRLGWILQVPEFTKRFRWRITWSSRASTSSAGRSAARSRRRWRSLGMSEQFFANPEAVDTGSGSSRCRCT